MAREDAPWTYETTRIVFKTIFFCADCLGLAVICILVSWAFVYNSGYSWSTPDGLFNWHMTLMVIFVVYLQAQGSLIYRLIPSNSRFLNKVIHASIHFIVCIGMSFGLLAIVEHTQLLNAPNFTSLHSWIGILTIVGYYLQYICGFFVYLYPPTTIDTKVWVLPIHRVIGQSLFISGVAAAISGVVEAGILFASTGPSDPPPSTTFLLNTGGLLALLFVGGIIYLLCDHIFRRRPAPFLHGTLGQSLYYGSTSPTRLVTPGPSGIGRHEKVVQ